MQNHVWMEVLEPLATCNQSGIITGDNVDGAQHIGRAVAP